LLSTSSSWIPCTQQVIGITARIYLFICWTTLNYPLHSFLGEGELSEMGDPKWFVDLCGLASQAASSDWNNVNTDAPSGNISKRVT